MNTIYNEISKEFGLEKPLSNATISANVEAYALLSEADKVSLIRSSRRANAEGFIL